MVSAGSIELRMTFGDDVMDHSWGDEEERNIFRADRVRRYGRSIRNWRTPKLHVIAGINESTTLVGPHAGHIRNDVVWQCGYSVTQETAQIVDSVPDGIEICQPCAEAMAFRRRRADEQESIDRSSYNEETRRLLEVADS